MSKSRAFFLCLLIAFAAWMAGCTKTYPEYQVTINKIVNLDSLGSPYCQYEYAPVDTNHKVKTNNIFLDKCGKYKVGDIIGIPDYHFSK